MLRSKKFTICGIVSLIVAVVLIIIGSCWSAIMNSITISESKSQAQLTPSSTDKWQHIPGPYDVQLNRKTSFFEVTNPDDVIYKGAVPVVVEHGPYYYREYDDFSDPPNWSESLNVPMTDTKKNGIKLVQNQYAKLNEDAEFKSADDVDTKFWQLNQANYGTWWQGYTLDDWRLGMSLVYSVVADGLGRQAAQQYIWTMISLNLFGLTGRQLNINKVLFNGLLTADLEKYMSTEPQWGPKNISNLIRWDDLLDADPVISGNAFYEFRTRFALSFELASIGVQNYKAQYAIAKEKLSLITGSMHQNCPNPTDYNCVAYMQWSSSAVSALQNSPSVVLISDTASGYPEMSYFSTEKVQKPLKAADNAELLDEIDSVSFFSQSEDQTSSTAYPYLFYITDAQGNAPAPSSLYNVDTIKSLLQIGATLKDIAVESSMTLDDFNKQNEAFGQLTQTLNLPNNSYTYMIYLWLKYLKTDTFMRAPEGGQFQLGVMGLLGGQAMKQYVNEMEIEVPMIVYSQVMNNAFGENVDCMDFYTNQVKFTNAMASNLCTGGDMQIMTFSFKDRMTTALALTDLVLNNGTYNPAFYVDFMFLTGLSGSDINNLLFVSTSSFQQYMQANLFAPVFDHYKDSCTIPEYNNIYKVACSKKDLAYAQWIDKSVLSNPMPYMTPTTDSYVNTYRQMSGLDNPIELGDYLEKAGKTKFAVTVKDCHEFFQTNRLFNLQIIGDILLNKISDYDSVFTNDQTRAYIRYFIAQLALGGMFTYRSPREMAEGYTDPHVYILNQMPVWMGGDQLTSPFLSINVGPTSATNMNVDFLTGTDDYLFTRWVANWNNVPYINVRKYDYKNIFETEYIASNPWPEQVALNGTDGVQFHPDVQTTDYLSCWVNDLGRNGFFLYSYTDKDTYSGLELYYFNIDPKIMSKTDAENVRIYDPYFDGTSTMTRLLQAPVIASKGHYYQLDQDGLNIASPILDINHKPVVPNAEDDDTRLGIEHYSGVTVVALQRLQMNFYIQKDYLYDWFQKGDMLTPLVYVKRESVMSQSLVQSLLGDLQVAAKIVPAGMGVMIGIGALLLLLAICMFYKCKQAKAQEGGSSFKNELINKTNDASMTNDGETRYR